MTSLRILIVCLFALWRLPAFSAAMHYDVAFDTTGKYLCVTLAATSLEGDETLLKLPVWAPGYYLIMDYPKHLVDFAATGPRGNAIAWTKEGKNGWRVRHGDEKDIKVTYRIYADAQSVADSKITPHRAFIAGNGVFMHIDGRKEMPVTVRFDLPSNWREISTGLDPVPGHPGTFAARDIDVLYDCPVLAGNHTVVGFEVDGRPYRLALETPDGIHDTPFIPDLRKVIATATGLIGDVPYSHYTFILMGPGGGGLEHTNSQACFGGNFRFSGRGAYLGFLSFITHEFYHLYNVKTIRPVELGPFDYDREVFTPGLWISEGLTVYYESVILRRAGLMTADERLREMNDFIRKVENTGGGRHMSLRQSSYDIWLNFFNRSANGARTRISYYDKGPILGLLMDIEIRRMTGNAKSLDDVMRALYYDFYKERGRGFTEEEFWDVCASVAGGPLTEMRRYVDTTDEIDYAKYLGYAGLTVDLAPLPGEREDGGGVVRKSWNIGLKARCTPMEEAIRNSIL